MNNLIAVYQRQPLQEPKLVCIVPKDSEAHQYYQYLDRKYRADHIADLKKPLSDSELIYRTFGRSFTIGLFNGDLAELAKDRVNLCPWQRDLYDKEGLDALREKLLVRFPSTMAIYRDDNLWHLYRRNNETMDFQEFCQQYSDEDVLDIIYRGSFHLYTFEDVEFRETAPDELPGETN